MITHDDFHAFLLCKTKWRLKSAGATGIQCEFAELQRHLLEEYKQECRSRLLSRFPADECIESLPLDRIRDDKKCRMVINCMVQAQDLQSHLHAVERIPSSGRKQPEAFVPVRFVPTEKITKHDKLMLAFDALALSLTTGTTLTSGRIVHGVEQKSSKVQLTDLMKAARSEVRQIRAQQENQTPPPLFLNKHCAECEYQPQCRQTAIEKDDLSLLSGMTEKAWWRIRLLLTYTKISDSPQWDRAASFAGTSAGVSRLHQRTTDFGFTPASRAALRMLLRVDRSATARSMVSRGVRNRE